MTTFTITVDGGVELDAEPATDALTCLKTLGVSKAAAVKLLTQALQEGESELRLGSGRSDCVTVTRDLA